ncbi:MAG: hypothetical protein JSV44_09810, partial [Candidatus Zixiibacteriota bacterium]
MKVIPYILYIYLLGFHITILSRVTAIYGITIDLTALLVALIALRKNDLTAVWFALAAGIVAGTVRLDLMPWEMLFLAGIALAIHRCSTRMNLESISSRMLLLGGALLIHQLLISVVVSTADFLNILLRLILPGTIYTLVFGWLF